MAMPYAKKFNIPLPGGVSPDEFDFFHELIAHEETGRLGCPGYVDGLFAGFAIGLPPLINFYQGKDKDQIVKEILTGEKRVCLAITGPEAGSDVANHTTVATLSADKSHWVVRGLKKWITCGRWLRDFDGVLFRRFHIQGKISFEDPCRHGTKNAARLFLLHEDEDLLLHFSQ